MPHITNDRLAEGILDVLSSQDRKQLKTRLVDVGTSFAVELACDFVERRTGLIRSSCRPVAKVIVKKLRKNIRTRFAD